MDHNKKPRLMLRGRAEVAKQNAAVAELLSENRAEISVVYFRSGYGPGDFPSGKKYGLKRRKEEEV